ncbi:MAG: pyridoxamine 5'-phosphate oxidase [Gemmatimonadaceae bacterium]
MNIADLRRDYSLASLDVADVDADPFTQFTRWFDDAQRAELPEPNAMTLATCAPDGRPSARVVLLKGVDARGFVFFTDYRSRKAQELEASPWGSLVFLWKEVERQVRVAGRVERVSHDESAAYYQSRPLGSRLGAWASVQSAVIPGRTWLEDALARVTAQHPGGDPPLPPHWGGFRLVPDELEFWQGRRNRLHDRLRYRGGADRWTIERLSP